MTDVPRLEMNFRLPLDRFALEVNYTTTRQVTGVFGVSGAGKTSLLESIAGLRRKVQGVIRLGTDTWVDSRNKQYVPPNRRHIGYVPQESLLFPHKNVRENLRAGAGRARETGQPLEQIFERVVELLDVRHLLTRRVGTLSGGERQRVALGRAICSGPRLLLLDEPLASLDVGLRYKILPFLHRIKKEFQLPMILVSHDPVEVQALCDELLVLKDGKVINQGAPREVLTNPDIFPIASREGFQNIFPAIVQRHEAEITILSMGDEQSTVEIVAPRVDATAGTHILVSIAAYEIILGTQRPVGLSARNILPARILSIESAGTLNLLTAQLAKDVPNLVVELTEHSCRDMDLAPDKPIYLIIKTASWRIHHEE